MKLISAFVVVAALLLITATAALASHGAGPPFAPVPAHGSIWMGNGLSYYGVTVPVPDHGSVWFGEELNVLAQNDE